MNRTTSTFHAVFAVSFFALGVVGCDSGSAGDDDSRQAGVATLSLLQAPADVACLRIAAVGSNRAVVRTFALTAGQAATLTLQALPLGSVVFNAEAFAETCALVSATSVPHYVSEPLNVTLVRGTATALTLQLRTNGRAIISIDFDRPADAPCLTAAECGDSNPCTVDTCAAGLCVRAPLAIDDSNACTLDFCNVASGPSHTPITCDDGNPATLDSCDSTTGCFANPVGGVALTVNKVGLASAGAMVTSNPPGITCGATCSGVFPSGTVVTLTTTVDGSVFSGWSGGGCTGVGTCTITVISNATVTANYRAARIALSAGAGSCLRDPGNALDKARTLLTNRGLTASLVAADEINTPAEISAYDAIVIGGPGDSCAQIDATGYDAIVDDYIRNNGGGVVATGWLLYVAPTIPNLLADLPTVQGQGYLNGSQLITAVAGSPITVGVDSFTGAQYVPSGDGLKSGAGSLLSVGSTSVGASWTVGSGRTVFLGPMFLENYNTYQNESLLDGTQPQSIELFLRAIEWAAKAR